MTDTRTWTYSGTCTHEALCWFSMQVTNGWESEMERPREGLVYISNHTGGAERRCLDPLAEPAHVVPHSFGEWLGYTFALAFSWTSVTGTKLVATANQFGGYELTLVEHRPEPTGPDQFCDTGSFYRRALNLEGVRFELKA